MSSLALRRKVEQMERRRTTRRLVEIAVAFRTASATIACEMTNISDNGAQLQMPDPPVEGVTGWLILDGAEIGARVVWSGETSCGIEFEQTIGEFTLKQMVGSNAQEAPTANASRIQAGRKRSGLVSRD